MFSDQQSIEALKTEISIPLSPEFTKDTLTSPPFTSILGIFNCRDSGGLPSSALKSKYAFRSGTLEKLAPDAHDAVKNLGISKIFDLRSLKEVTEFPDPFIDGIEVIAAPGTLENETTVQAQKSQEEKENPSLLGMYLTILETHKNIFTKVLEHVRDHPDQSFLFHCTAGKDRTAVLAYLLHSIAGSPLNVIDLDYALTRVGIEPVRDMLTAKLTAGGRLDLNDPKVAVYANVPVDGMSQLDEKVKEKYGSVEQYVKEAIGLSGGDVKAIKTNLRTAP